MSLLTDRASFVSAALRGLKAPVIADHARIINFLCLSRKRSRLCAV